MTVGDTVFHVLTRTLLKEVWMCFILRQVMHVTIFINNFLMVQHFATWASLGIYTQLKLKTKLIEQCKSCVICPKIKHIQIDLACQRISIQGPNFRTIHFLRYFTPSLLLATQLPSLEVPSCSTHTQLQH